jgi:hypothetical protein
LIGFGTNGKGRILNYDILDFIDVDIAKCAFHLYSGVAKDHLLEALYRKVIGFERRFRKG